MISFQCDYLAGAHPKILQRLNETNLEATPGYGCDLYCESAKKRILAACATPDADVHFLVGGTQTNTTVIASILRSHQGVLCAEEGHIACHETGAIESTGHKVLPLPSPDGKITAGQVEKILRADRCCEIREHMVQPGMLYLSFPTESGAIYSKKELVDLYNVCCRYGIPLYIDGARLGYGLASPQSDLTLPELAALCDVFYIGGTKCGALFGEAVVIRSEALKRDFRYFIKQRGGMLAKGRLLGIQFGVLFEDGLYFSICREAVLQALRIRRAFEEKGIGMYGGSTTNQQFPILKKEQLAFLNERYRSEFWADAGAGRSIVRFCTSWSTPTQDVEALLADIAAMPD